MVNKYDKEVMTAKNGLTVTKLNNYQLHSMYDPIKEAKKYVDQNFKVGYTHILFGFGDGYIVESFLRKKTDDETIVVIEPFLDEVASVKGDYILIQNNNVQSILYNLKDFMKITERFNILCSPNYDKIDPELYKEFLAAFKEQLYIGVTNENTLKAYSAEWQKNYIYNIGNVIKDKNLSTLYEKFDCPVVIASGGPSLTKQLPLLKEYREKVLLIAAGSTINTLLNEHIEPDFVISIDGTIANYRHFSNLYLEKSRLIYLMTNYPTIRNHFKNQGYYFLNFSEKRFKEHFNNLIDEPIVCLPGGGSVANFALTVAAYISRGPIALIGQDLAYTNNQTHAKSNVYYKEIDIKSSLKNGTFYYQGYFGDQVLTTYAFLGMKKSFEALMDFIPNKEVYNCTEGGIFIDKMIQIPFNKFLETHCIFDKCKLNLSDDSEIIEKDKSEIIIKLYKEIKIYKQLINLLEKNIKLIESNKSNIQFPTETLKKLDKNDSKIKKLSNDTCISRILDPINLYVLKYFKPKENETKEETYNRVKMQNRVLYNKMVDAIKETENYVNDLILQIEAAE